MRIQHNIMAMNAYRNYNNNTSKLSKNLEKLSSGYKINRAGDDAAGLAISEKMRAQITGLTQAQANAKSGINLVQTAEGALQEVHDMLNRMVKLADQSANGIYTDNGVDREALQEEVTALKTEIDRISKASNFNGKTLLDGSLGGGVTGASGKLGTTDIAFQAKAGMSFEIKVDATATDSKVAETNGAVVLTLGTKTGAGKVTADDVNALLKEAGIDATVSFEGEIGGAAATDVMATITSAKPANAKVTVGGIDFESTKAGNVTNTIKIATINGSAGQSAAIANDGTIILNLKGDETADDINKLLSDAGIDVKATKVGTITADTTGKALAGGAGLGGSGLNLQIGDTSDDFNKITVSIDDMSTKGLSIDGIDISTETGASNAVKAINDAIDTVSQQRGKLGATQNRLEHTINNLSVMTENIQDAESTIRDTDVADEMMAYTKNNILIQSAQAMLAQANQVPQGVLQLLQ